MDCSRVEEDLRLAALEGRLIITKRTNRPASDYTCLHADAEEQFTELCAILGLGDEWSSRCGICNADDWQTLDAQAVRTLDAQAVRGQVPDGVLAAESVFYKCGSCNQIFWPGAKYDDTMTTLKNLALNETVSVT